MTVAVIKRSELDKLEPSPSSAKKNLIWDRHVKGFGVYMTSTGVISFLYQYRMPGQKTKSGKIGNHGELTVKQARDQAADWANMRRRGIDPLAEIKRHRDEDLAKAQLTVGNYVEAFILRRSERDKEFKTAAQRSLRNDVIGILGEKRLDEIQIEDVEAFANKLRPRGPSAERTGLNYLNIVLNDAVKRGKLAYNPASAVETPRAGERTRTFDEHEFQRFLEASNDVGGPRGDILEVLMRLAKRKEEIARMTWDQLDLDVRILSIPDTVSKNGEPYRVELPRQVRDIIISQQPDQRLRTGQVFTLDGRNWPQMGAQVKDLLDANMARRVQSANERDGTALSIKHFTVHDVRTAVASRLEGAPFMLGNNLIDRILLHKKEGKITRAYQRATLETEAGVAMQAWNDHLDELMAKESAWPGGRLLGPIKPKDRHERLLHFRHGWQLRTDQAVAKVRHKTVGETETDRRRNSRRAKANAAKA